MLSVVLDAPDVPGHVVEFILYHELLHRELGAERQGGRFVVHSKRFRAEERRFERYGEAVAFLESGSKPTRPRIGSMSYSCRSTFRRALS